MTLGGRDPELTPRRWLTDLLRDGVARYRRSQRGAGFEELNWLWLNVGALLVGGLALAVVWAVGVPTGHWSFSLGVLVFAVTRTLLDYHGSAGFYFPGVPTWRQVRARAT